MDTSIHSEPPAEAASACSEFLAPNDTRRARMGVMHGWERSALKHGPFVAAVVVISIITSALIAFVPFHIG